MTTHSVTEHLQHTAALASWARTRENLTQTQCRVSTNELPF